MQKPTGKFPPCPSPKGWGYLRSCQFRGVEGVPQGAHCGYRCIALPDRRFHDLCCIARKKTEPKFGPAGPPPNCGRASPRPSKRVAKAGSRAGHHHPSKTRADSRPAASSYCAGTSTSRENATKPKDAKDHGTRGIRMKKHVLANCLPFPHYFTRMAFGQNGQ